MSKRKPPKLHLNEFLSSYTVCMKTDLKELRNTIILMFAPHSEEIYKIYFLSREYVKNEY